MYLTLRKFIYFEYFQILRDDGMVLWYHNHNKNQSQTDAAYGNAWYMYTCISIYGDEMKETTRACPL